MLCLLMLNHTNDPELKEALENFVADLEEPQLTELTKLMRDEGIPFPTIAVDKPKADERQVPPGAKFTEAEIGSLLVVKLEGLLAVCHVSMIQSTRDEIGALFYKFHGQLMTQAFLLKKLMQKRGWLMVPPSYGVPAQTLPD